MHSFHFFLWWTLLNNSDVFRFKHLTFDLLNITVCAETYMSIILYTNIVKILLDSRIISMLFKYEIE